MKAELKQHGEEGVIATPRSGRSLRDLLAMTLAAALLAALPPCNLAAQTQRPAPGPTPAVVAPRIERTRLANGLDVWLVRRTQLPVVSAQMVVRAGSAQDGDLAGLAEVTAALMDEGAGKLTALEFADKVNDIGAQLQVTANLEWMGVSVQTLSRHLPATLALMGDVLARPRFEAEELERERKARMQSLRRQGDDPVIIANLRFNEQIYGASHPYGRAANGTVETVPRITRDDVVRFHKTWVRPNNAFLIVVGDVTMAQLKTELTNAFAGWERAAVPANTPPSRPEARPTSIYLIDKPGAAQSQIRIGLPATPRTSADYTALQVLNNALGGQFSSRINLNLREAKGFTYGARSALDWRRGDGPFFASGGFFTAKTDSSLVELLKEIRDVRSTRPLTAEELAFSRGALVRAYPRRLETGQSTVTLLADLAYYGLPENEITEYLARIEKISEADAKGAAAKYIDPDHLTIVIVGDLAQIRAGVEALGIAPVTVLEESRKAIGAGQ